jgi:midasin (ATPase involved in ribosome maturation)
LNRLLNDNRQLFVTQSPAGEQDAERKRLSRAFRNDHREEVSIAEIRRSKLLIQTMFDLQKSRSEKGVFAFAFAGQSS